MVRLEDQQKVILQIEKLFQFLYGAIGRNRVKYRT